MVRGLLVDGRSVLDRLNGEFFGINFQQLQEGLGEHYLVASRPKHISFIAHGFAKALDELSIVFQTRFGLQLLDCPQPAGCLNHKSGQMIKLSISKRAVSIKGEFSG
jgi:hypothetical protein